MSKLEKKLKYFKQDGYVNLGRALGPTEVSEIIGYVNTMLIDPNYKMDLLSIDESHRIHKILYPLAKSEKLLKYIVHPMILNVLLELVEDITQIVLTWEDILIKEPLYGIPVHYHQDLALQSTKYDIFSFGIYLHDSDENPVYYLPGSFKYGALTKDELYDVVAANKEKFVPLNAKAGDISMHYVKTIHYSDINRSEKPRYTWYLEYRTMNQLRQDSPWDDDWIMKRRAIFVAALQQYAPEYLDRLAPDIDQLLPYIRELQLRVPQTNEYVQYDMESPYNHFA